MREKIQIETGPQIGGIHLSDAPLDRVSSIGDQDIQSTVLLYQVIKRFFYRFSSKKQMDYAFYTIRNIRSSAYDN